MDAKVDLNDVALLVEVVRARSFSGAAQARGVPVSTVSRRISRLEAALGLRLLERTTRRLALTDAGRSYVGHAERAIADLAEGGALIRELQQEPRGRVCICAPTPLGGTVTDVVAAYLARHPGVSVDLYLSDSVDLAACDLAIVHRTVDTADFVARPIWQRSRKLLYAAPSYLRARGTPRRLEELARHAIVSSQPTWTLLRGRTTTKLALSLRLFVSDSTAARRAAIAGVGITMVPEVLCVDDVARGRLVQVLPRYAGVAGGVSLLYRAHRAQTAAVRACIEHFLTELPRVDPATRA